MATSDRIYIDEEFKNMADRLVKRQIPGTESLQGIFRDTRELAVFAAGLGFRKQHFREVTKNGREIKLSALQRIDLGGREIVEAVGVAHTDSVAILHPARQQELAQIFEGYLNGGLQYIAGMTNDDHSDLQIVAALIKSEYSPQETRDEVIDLLAHRL